MSSLETLIHHMDIKMSARMIGIFLQTVGLAVFWVDKIEYIYTIGFFQCIIFFCDFFLVSLQLVFFSLSYENQNDQNRFKNISFPIRPIFQNLKKVEAFRRIVIFVKGIGAQRQICTFSIFFLLMVNFLLLRNFRKIVRFPNERCHL